MNDLRSYFFVFLIFGILLVQACDENDELFENNYPIYDEDLLNFEGITETDETGRKINNIDQDDWLELHYNLRDGSSDFFFEPWFWFIDGNCEYSSGKVFINWTTPSEEDFLFWNILRSDINNHLFAEIINEESIPAKGNASVPTDYYYIDENISINETYYYWLELTKVDS
ncbi:MAG: hypothetical protein K8R49_00195, partial [Candidatus Cloacimonetes bacterium]|nr:hypothetical protein [Candidatus Cloacimonadota bacterium]